MAIQLRCPFGQSLSPSGRMLLCRSFSQVACALPRVTEKHGTHRQRRVKRYVGPVKGSWSVVQRTRSLGARGPSNPTHHRQKRAARHLVLASTASPKDKPGEQQPPFAHIYDALAGWHVPNFVWRTVGTFLLTGQVALRIFTGSLNLEQLQEQLARIGPQTLGVSMLTSSFVGM
eukprot:1635513-Pyramimonas_sp.AAC.1